MKLSHSLKTLCTLFALLTSFHLKCQENLAAKREAFILFPYKVIFAESVRETTDWEVKAGAKYRSKDHLILKDGHLILSHYSGQLLEFIGDTVINLSKVTASLEFDKFSYKKQYFEFLNDSTLPQLKRFDPVTVCMLERSIILRYPRKNKVTIPRGSKIFIQWEAIYENYKELDYQISLANIFDEVLAEFIVHGNELELDLSNFSLEKEEMLLVEISCPDMPGRPSTYVGYEFSEDADTTIEKTLGTSIEHLQTAVTLEVEQSYLAAQQHYEKAAYLSEKGIYQSFLDNFIQRKSQLDTGGFLKD